MEFAQKPHRDGERGLTQLLRSPRRVRHAKHVMSGFPFPRGTGAAERLLRARQRSKRWRHSTEEAKPDISVLTGPTCRRGGRRTRPTVTDMTRPGRGGGSRSRGGRGHVRLPPSSSSARVRPIGTTSVLSHVFRGWNVHVFRIFQRFAGTSVSSVTSSVTTSWLVLKLASLSASTVVRVCCLLRFLARGPLARLPLLIRHLQF